MRQVVESKFNIYRFTEPLKIVLMEPLRINSKRIPSIDIFRALTMFLMIFVNDLWSISDVPHWLEHAAATEDMLGFSDVIFPSFLFILGMSIPLAIKGRMNKGEAKVQILKYIVIRSIALLVMGLFTVNLESGLLQTIGLSKPVFILLMLLSFFLIWNVYPRTESKKRKRVYSILKIIGILILVVLAFAFRDSEGGAFQIRWWGILGLIGWTYLLCAVIYLFLGHNWKYLLVVCFGFMLLCILAANSWLGVFGGIIPGDGCFHAFTMIGLMLSLLFQPDIKFSFLKKATISIIISFLLLLAGGIAHYWWIISKIQATPTWMFLCAGLSIASYIIIYWLIEIQGKGNWFNMIKPAGTATLTCYLVPYLFYAIFDLSHFQLPLVLTIGLVGLLKSIIFSFLVIGVTAIFNKMGIRLKI